MEHTRWDPIETIKNNPRYSLLLTVIALAFLIFIEQIGYADASIEGFKTIPIFNIICIILIPTLIVAIPLYLHANPPRKLKNSRIPSLVLAVPVILAFVFISYLFGSLFHNIFIDPTVMQCASQAAGFGPTPDPETLTCEITLEIIMQDGVIPLAEIVAWTYLVSMVPPPLYLLYIDIFGKIRENPLYTLVFTVPVAWVGLTGTGVHPGNLPPPLTGVSAISTALRLLLILPVVAVPLSLRYIFDSSLDEKIAEVQDEIDKAERAIGEDDFSKSLSHTDEAIEIGESIRESAQQKERVDDIDDLLDEAHQIRERAMGRKATYEELMSEIKKTKNRLERAESTLEKDSEAALERVEGVPERLEELRSKTDKHDFDELQRRADSLERRYDSIVADAESELEDDTGGEPTEIPQAPVESLTYDGIEKIEPVGSGGNADVYRAVADTPRGEITFALKEPRMSGTLHKETAERMMQEAETWDKLDDHDHIVGVIDYDSEPLPWIAMEYMDGGHIGEQAGEMEFDRALWTAIVTTEAVRHAHRKGVAHLDLKPENVLFRSVEDAWDVPKVADWGLSKHLLDHSKSVEGLSPQYSAPEQFDSSYGSADDITDVYQLGAVFYEMFTGEPPFDGDPARVMNKVMNEEPTPPSQIADVPPEIDEILLTAMATEKEDRYETVIYLRDSLRELYSTS